MVGEAPRLEVVSEDTGETTSETVEKKEYLLELQNGGQRKLKVPANWKVTFGPTTPFETKAGGRYDNCWALRLYEPKDKLRAIFTDVRSFRDMSITVMEKTIKTKRQVLERGSGKGGRSVVAEAKIEEWVDPDNPPENSEKPEDYLLRLGDASGQEKDDTIEF